MIRRSWQSIWEMDLDRDYPFLPGLLSWIRCGDFWSSPRYHLAQELRQIRQTHGSLAARSYRFALMRFGVYPVRAAQWDWADADTRTTQAYRNGYRHGRQGQVTRMICPLIRQTDSWYAWQAGYTSGALDGGAE